MNCLIMIFEVVVIEVVKKCNRYCTLNLTEFQLSAIAVHPFTHVSWGGRVGLAEVMN